MNFITKGLVLQVEFIAFAVDFVLFAVEFVAFAIEFGTLTLELQTTGRHCMPVCLIKVKVRNLKDRWRGSIISAEISGPPFEMYTNDVNKFFLIGGTDTMHAYAQ